MILKKFLLFLSSFSIVLSHLADSAVLENGIDLYRDRELPLASSQLRSQKDKISGRSIVKRGQNDDQNFCSSFCLCDTWFKLRRAKCNNRYLFSVETGVSNSVQALDLSRNSVSSLRDYELKNIGLVNLKYLNLSDNSINQIGSFAFFGIEKLTVLDLSNNHLYYILWDTFVESFNLRILRLDGNRFGTGIPELNSNSILELGLSNCHISHLGDKIFSGLKKLIRLDLSMNNMIEIGYRVIDSVPMLKEINLNENPWSCKTEAMKNLLTKFDERSIKYKISSCEFDVETISINLKKFERMTDVRPGSSIDEERGDRASEKKNNNNNNNNNNEDLDAWMTTEPPSSKACFPSGVPNSTESHRRIDTVAGFVAALSTISPIWLILTGFLIGVASSMLATYLWLAGSLSCYRCPAIPSRTTNGTRSDNGSQRVSLLGQPICPGTPPPPYRDVVLVSSTSSYNV